MAKLQLLLRHFAEPLLAATAPGSTAAAAPTPPPTAAAASAAQPSIAAAPGAADQIGTAIAEAVGALSRRCGWSVPFFAVQVQRLMRYRLLV